MKSNKTSKAKTNLPVSLAKDASASPNDTFIQVITAIRQHEPEAQNSIISELLREIGIDRLNKLNKLSDERIRAQNVFESFLKGTSSVEGKLKEYDSQQR